MIPTLGERFDRAPKSIRFTGVRNALAVIPLKEPESPVAKLTAPNMVWVNMSPEELEAEFVNECRQSGADPDLIPLMTARARYDGAFLKSRVLRPKAMMMPVLALVVGECRPSSPEGWALDDVRFGDVVVCTLRYTRNYDGPVADWPGCREITYLSADRATGIDVDGSRRVYFPQSDVVDCVAGNVFDAEKSWEEVA